MQSLVWQDLKSSSSHKCFNYDLRKTTEELMAELLATTDSSPHTLIPPTANERQGFCWMAEDPCNIEASTLRQWVPTTERAECSYTVGGVRVTAKAGEVADGPAALVVMFRDISHTLAVNVRGISKLEMGQQVLAVAMGGQTMAVLAGTQEIASGIAHSESREFSWPSQ